ncbi:MAG: hypothetical protein GY796_07025 [Chloroflexi bacterium]|nr:hypothetical protein [Chloroflexota bacterium]
MSNLTRQERRFLHQFLTDRFTLSELKTLAYYLGFPFEEYPHDIISDFAREVLQYYEREDELGELLKLMLEERPDDELAQIYANLPPADPRVKVELIIRNAVKENAQEIRQRIANSMGWRQEEVGIIWAVSGSLQMLLSLSQNKLPALLSLARDPQSWLPYEVESITLYEQLPRGDQSRWRRLIMDQAHPQMPAADAGLTETASAATSGGFLGLSVVKWIILLVVLVVVGIGVGSVLLVPRLELVNGCGVPLEVPTNPFIGGQVMKPGDSFSTPISPGEYRYVYNGRTILIEIDGQTLNWPVGEIEVAVNGRPLAPDTQETVTVGWGQRNTIEILRCE